MVDRGNLTKEPKATKVSSPIRLGIASDPGYSPGIMSLAIKDDNIYLVTRANSHIL